MQLSIITLNYKKPHLTLVCIASLYKQYKKALEEDEMEIIVVDNASGSEGDKSFKTLCNAVKKLRYSHVQVIANKENGFSNGCNFGAKKAKGKYLLFLNNDTQVLDQGLMDMGAFLDGHPTIGILGARMMGEDSMLQPSVGRFYTLPNVLLMLLGAERFGFLITSPFVIQQTDWVSGGSLMIRRSLFEKIQGFDENIFMYMEDVDICYRVHKAGFVVFFYPYVTIMHKGQGSSNRTFAIVHIYEGLLYFYKKYAPKWQQNMLQLLLLTKANVLITIGKLFHNDYFVKTYEEARSIIR
jgi:GT2 family glycosyltransferase